MNDQFEDNLPRGVALSWGLVKQPRRGPKREMNLKQIVDAAITIADKDGLAAVSMNKVAASLGFTPMSLYRYIPSKDDLLLLMQDAVCDIPIPPIKQGTTWRENLRTYVQACIGVFYKHPWFGDIPVSSVPLTPNNLQIVDWALRGMNELPLNDHEKMSVALLLSSYARSSGMIQRDLNQAIQSGKKQSAISGQDYSAALKQLVTPERFPDLYNVVISGAYTEENNEENNVGDDFEFGLERILDGIEYYIEKKRNR
ncbi:TetR/AcrR family transcriptional regulator [Heyndrickxia vini]|uniref:TetR/AcrR family transcriptional regulator n=1 Tax=Heyndrickxia vini TaxID=1476025 RepID=A0ABX7E348_9BACI|nr:TetR/AcrR family transcriptional regulator [Heyndrickxia vini]QQZ09671.1 TetR/AcrR family transcriptional regulator [Heyndrickxia vini]